MRCDPEANEANGRRIPSLIAALCVAINAWWLAITPSNDRDWQPNVSVAAHADIDGDSIKLERIPDAEVKGPVALAGLPVRVVGDIEAHRADRQDEAEARAYTVLHVV